MLLAIDVGNTNAVLGLYKPILGRTPARFEPEPIAHWRVTTPDERTSGATTPDEFGVLLRSLFESSGIALSDVTGICIASVVPPADSTLRRVCELYFNLRPLFIEPGVKTGMPILTDNPNEVGADRIVDCVAAYERFRSACITVDMGTATVFNAVSAKGEFLGGAIAPGLGISADALFAKAARLPRIDVRKPAKVIGTGTVDNIQIGLYYGYIGLVDGILERMIAEFEGHHPELKGAIPIIATGGLAPLIAEGSRYLKLVDPHLTLTGVRLVYERHQQRSRPATRAARAGRT
jgi:type III pantothenate kinase